MSELDKLIIEAQNYLNAKLPEKSLEFSLKALVINNISPEGNLLAALAYYQLEKLIDSRKYFELCLEKVKLMPEMLEKYAIVLSLTDNIIEAIKVFKEIIKNYPAYTLVFYNYGCCLMGNKNYQEAILQFNNAEKHGFINEELYFYRGTCYYNLNKYDIAEIDLLKACELKPEHAEAAFILGDLCYNKSLWEKAVAYYSRALYYNADHSNALKQRLFARIQIKDKEGFLLNREAAQADADNLLLSNIPFINIKNKDGKIMQITKITISDKGKLNFNCL